MKVALLGLVVLAGCVRQGAFHCTEDAQCRVGSVDGKCEPSATFCAFPDITCAAGFRYGDQAGAVSNECVTGDGAVTIGGAVTGLAGTGLVLQNNAADDLVVLADGPFVFAATVASGAGYDVKVHQEPLVQTCQLTNATGTAGAFDVSDVTVACQTDPGILCGSEHCDPKDVCCVKSGVATCENGCNGAGSKPIRCDSHKDCVAAGQLNDVCCGNLDGSDKVTSVSCTRASSCTQPTHAYFCDPLSINPCPDGGTCTSTDDPFPGYFRCF